MNPPSDSGTEPAPDATATNTSPPSPELPGFLLQAFILLLDLARRPGLVDPIHLEPIGDQEEFHCRWAEAGTLKSVRIRSTKSMFLNSQVLAWAAAMEAGHPDHESTLQLIGMVHPRLEKTKTIGQVTLTKRALDTASLLAEATAALNTFRAAGNLPGTAPLPPSTTALLAEKLIPYCAEPRQLTPPQLAELLAEAIRQAAA